MRYYSLKYKNKKDSSDQGIFYYEVFKDLLKND
jgi:hypothetical protein